MKYRINPAKLKKAPVQLMPVLFAALEFDDQSPWFPQLRQYMYPSTDEERWDELVDTVKRRSYELRIEAEQRFDHKMNKIVRRLKSLQ